MNWYLMVLRKYAVFSGRARRKEFWYFTLINAIITFVLIGLDFALGSVLFESVGILSGIYSIAVLIPSFAVLVRRLHDTGHSGWWVATNVLFIGIMTLAGLMSLLVMQAMPLNTTAGAWLFVLCTTFSFLMGAANLILGVAIFVFTILKSQPGTNRYGINPIA